MPEIRYIAQREQQTFLYAIQYRAIAHDQTKPLTPSKIKKK